MNSKEITVEEKRHNTSEMVLGLVDHNPGSSQNRNKKSSHNCVSCFITLE